METDVWSVTLLQKAKHPLVNEEELQAILAEVKVMAPLALVEDTWRAVRLLSSTARHTLQAGRGDLALPLITAVLELCPQPFNRLALLQQGNKGCALLNSMPSLENLREVHGEDVLYVVCSVIMIWHGAVASSTTVCSNPRSFLSFFHNVGHFITQFVDNVTTLESLSGCWLYNTLVFAHRLKETQTVAFYLLEEIFGGERLEEITGTNKWQLLNCSTGKNACVRVGLRNPQAATMWNRLCLSLYAHGCALLHAGQEEVCRNASTVIDILQQAFDGELINYMTEFRSPLHLSLQDAMVLRDRASREDISLPRETFAPLRVACFLNLVVKETRCDSLVEYPFTSVSSVVALAWRHRLKDIAMEVLQAGLPVDSHASSLVVWGKELEYLLDNASERPVSRLAAVAGTAEAYRSGTQDNRGQKHNVRRGPGVPLPLLHEVLQDELSATEVLRTLVLSRRIEELLPVALAIVRGESAFRLQLLGDKIAPSFILDGLTYLVERLVNEGDLPLARCFLPFVAGICVRMPSRANLLAIIQTIAVFAKCCPDNGGQWENIATIFSSFAPPHRSTDAPAYRQTKTTLTGRTFSTRRQVFESLSGDTSVTSDSRSYCLVQVMFCRDQREVRVLHTRSCGTVEGLATHWEKILPIGEVLLGLVAQMQDIEVQNRWHLGVASRQEASSSSVSEDPSRTDGKRNETAVVEPDEKGAKDRADWWEKRRSLDHAIGDVVKVMQSDKAFGCWRVFMCGDLPFSCQVVIRRTALHLLRVLDSPAHHVEDVMMILGGLPFIRERCSPIDELLFNPSHVAVGHESCTMCEEVLFSVSLVLESMLLNQGIVKPSDGLHDASREACFCILGVLWSAAIGSEKQQTGQSHSDHVDLFNTPRTPVYLLLDNEFHCLPFEGIDVLRSGSVSRVPTAEFVSSAANRTELIGNGLAYCVIDPAGVMPKTSKKLLPVCHRGGWLVNSKKLSPGELLHELYSSRARLYVYVGHGKGESLLHRRELYERFPDQGDFPAVFLMGCSSAYMDGGSSYDCYGMPYALLHAGCPVFLGCLWHVTDGEIDRLTKRLLSLVAGGSENDEKSVHRAETIGEALALARRVCKLPHLTGCATVLYGINLPLYASGGEEN